VKDGDLQGDGQAGAGSQIRLAGGWRSFQWVRDRYLDGTYTWPEYLAKLQSPTPPPAPRVYANTHHTYWSAWDLVAAVRIMPSLGNANLQWVSPNKLRLTTGLPGAVTCYEAGYYKHLERIDTTDQIVYITFDDGPYVNDAGLQDTAILLSAIQTWNESNTPAARVTFMVCGIKAEMNEAHEDVTRTIVGPPHNHKLGNHSYHHPQPFAQRSADEIRQEVIRNRLVVIKILGDAGNLSILFRPPGEMGWPGTPPNQDAINAIASAGHVTVFHNVTGNDSGLAQQQVLENVQSTFFKLSEAERKGAIVLLHNGRQYTTEDVPAILDFFQEQGYAMHSLPIAMVPPLK
jgi:peptidoglycan/xylan/chitin deacetylase (PgdA/CDA1 family)